ncbi:MAG: hypothetical protein JST55_02150 [Bacteroidetes bacterium]|nr:hypothetical protein [Bacteroidota bacterium]
MFNMNVKMKFIELKSMGMPMYKIANELGVHRVTIMRWNRELAPYILIAKEDMINEMLFENGCMKLNRIEKISKFLQFITACWKSQGKIKNSTFQAYSIKSQNLHVCL